MRRNSLLEQRANQIDKEYRAGMQRLNSMSDKLLVFKEKDQMWSSKIKEIEKKHSSEKMENELTQIRYAELYALFQEKKESFERQFSEQKKTIWRLLKFRNRIKTYIKPRLRELRATVEKNRDQIEFLKQELANQKNSFQKETTLKDLKIEDLKSNIENLMSAVKSQTQIHEKEQRQLINLHEKERSALLQRLSQIGSQHQLEKSSLESTIATQSSQLIQLAALIEENDRIKNNLVSLERSKEEFKLKAQQEIFLLQEKMGQYQSDAKTTLNEIQILKNEKEEMEHKLNERTQACDSQVESVRLLWQDQLKLTEKFQTRNETLEKINKQLSEKLGQFQAHLHAKELELKSLRDDLKKPPHPPSNLLPPTPEVPLDYSLPYINFEEEASH